MAAKKKASEKPEVPTDWKAIAVALWHDVHFAAENLKAPGSGMLLNSTTGEFRHWKERFADTLELMPGVTVDREAMHALDLPKRQRVKFFKERAAAEAAAARAESQGGAHER